MKKAAIIVYILTTILFASEEEIEHKKFVKALNEALAHYSEVLKSKKSKGVGFLLSPIDYNTTVLILTSYDEKYKKFKNEKKNLKDNISVKRLSTFYIDALEQNIDIEFTDISQYYSRLGYEEYILYHLKKDLDENNIAVKDREELLLHLEKLLLLDTFAVYSLTIAQNNFYARNMKKFINLMMNNPTNNIIFDDDSYKKFLFYLDKTMELLFEHIEDDEFDSFKKSIQEEMAFIRKSVLNKNIAKSASIDYWIRAQVAMRYYVTLHHSFSLTNSIEKHRTLFYDLF